jgi:DNA repair ATPase RecN
MAKKKGVKKGVKKGTKKTTHKKAVKKKAIKPILRSIRKSPPKAATKTAKSQGDHLADRMLQVASNMVAFQMLLSHVLRPIAGDPLAEGASLDEMSERLRTVRNQLQAALAHHPVMSQKITEAYNRAEQLWKTHQTLPMGDSRHQQLQTEAKELSQKTREACASMSDLVAALRSLT